MKKSLIALALASLCATANALEPDYGDSEMGGYVGGSGGDPSGGVTIIGKRQVGVNIPDIWGGQNERLTPVARRPSGDMGDPSTGVAARGAPATPDERRKRREDCLQDCSVSFQISNNTCIDTIGDMRYQMSIRPYWSAVGGAIAGAIATRNAAGALLGAPIAWLYSTQINDQIVSTFAAQCAGAAAQDWNHCATAVCEAWFLPFLLLTARRRQEEEDEAS